MSLPAADEVSDSSVSSDELDSGHYFRHGRAWSRLMFELPIVERSYALLSLIVVCLTLVVTLMVLNSITPFSRPVRMIFENSNSGYESPRLFPLSPDRVPLPVALSRYIIRRYVIAREAYEYNKDSLDQNYRMVYNYSQPDQFTAYRQALSPDNPRSPLNVLERHSTRRVENPDVSIKLGSVRDGAVEGTAEVHYMEVVQSPGGVTQTPRALRIAFTMNEISISKAEKRVYQYDAATRSMAPLTGPLLLRVSDYQPLPNP